MAHGRSRSRDIEFGDVVEYTSQAETVLLRLRKDNQISETRVIVMDKGQKSAAFSGQRKEGFDLRVRVAWIVEGGWLHGFDRGLRYCVSSHNAGGDSRLR